MKRRLIRFTALVFAILLAACTTLPLAAPPAAPPEGIQRPPLRNELIGSVQSMPKNHFDMPLDATPDPEAGHIYFTATSLNGPGVFRVSADGTDETVLAVGAPFVNLLGIAAGSDGRRLYVADTALGTDGRQGRIYLVPAEGGTPSVVAGSEGTAPRALEIVAEEGMDLIYFTGVDPTDGEPAVLRIPASGAAAPMILARGAPLVAPEGVAVAATGKIYVADRGTDGQAGRLFEVAGATVTPIAEGIGMGALAGVTLTLDESVLLVSALDRETGTAQVVLVVVASHDTGLVTKGIGQNRGAGGVHRARNSNVFAWADSTIGGRGRVYRIDLAGQ